MKLFTVTHEVGEYEQKEVEVVGIFPSLEEAFALVRSVGFEGGEFDEHFNHYFFSRQHGNVAGECVEHTDWVWVKEFELGVIQDEYEVFSTHYKTSQNGK